MSKKRKATGLLCFLASIALLYAGFHFLPPGDYGKELVTTLGIAGWKSAVCIASGLCFLLIGVSILGVMAYSKPFTLRMNALILLVYAIWLVPLYIGYSFRWTFDSCYSISLFTSLLLVAISDARELLARKKLPVDSNSRTA